MYYIIIFIMFLLLVICVRRNTILFKMVNNYSSIITEQGMKNHEYMNQLMIVSGYLDCNDYNKTRKYLNTIIEDHRIGKYYEIRELSKFKDGGLKKLLYYKINKMKNNDIEYYLSVSESFIDCFNNIDINTYSDITKIIGVLLDNAIDSSKISNEKTIDMTFSKKENALIISISNDFIERVNLRKIDKEGYTSKGIGHGFGLQIVKRIINNNEKLCLSTSIDKETFIQTITIIL